MMKIEWHNDGASDSSSDARKIFVYVLISLDGIFVSRQRCLAIYLCY